MKFTNEKSMVPVLEYSLFGETDPSVHRYKWRKLGAGDMDGGGELLAMLQKVFSYDLQQLYKENMSVAPVLVGVETKGLGRSLVDPCSWDKELQLLWETLPQKVKVEK